MFIDNTGNKWLFPTYSWCDRWFRWNLQSNNDQLLKPSWFVKQRRKLKRWVTWNLQINQEWTHVFETYSRFITIFCCTLYSLIFNRKRALVMDVAAILPLISH